MVRFKNRWLLVEFIPCKSGPTQEGNGDLDSKEIWAALKQSVLTNFGDTGWGAVSMSLTVKYYSPRTNVCIVRVAREQHKIAWGALTFISSIEGQKYIPHVVQLSGTIKQVQLAAIQHNRIIIARYRARSKRPAGYQDSYDDYLKSNEAEIEAMQD